jgi:hypothetical protein
MYGRPDAMQAAKAQRNAPGDTKNTLNAVRTTLLSITKKPDHTQNEPLAIMRQGVEEERGYGSTGGVRGRRGKGTAGAECRRRIKE